MKTKLDCGHEPSNHSEYTTGTALTPDGREVCWDCAFKEEVKQMNTDATTMAYLSDDSNAITNWTGRIFSNQVRILSHMVDNFGGERTYLRFKFNNDIWSGFSMGPGMYVRARKTKLKFLYQ